MTFGRISFVLIFFLLLAYAGVTWWKEFEDTKECARKGGRMVQVNYKPVCARMEIIK